MTLPELERLRADLAAAAARPRRRRRRRGLVATLLVLLAVAVPAAATRPLWAPLTGGETALPAQAPRTLQREIATGVAPSGERWRLVAYRARLRGGGIGVCLHLVAPNAGSGSCRAPARPGLALVEDRSTGRAIVHGLAPGDAARVELHLAGGGRRVALPQAHAVPELRERVHVVLADVGDAAGRSRLLRAVARDAAGREVGRTP